MTERIEKPLEDVGVDICTTDVWMNFFQTLQKSYSFKYE
jgi:hypothetical protein